MGIVIDPPSLDLLACIRQVTGLSDIQALIAEAAIERFYVPVLSGFSGLREVELHASLIGPLLKRFRRELRAMIDGDR